MSTLKILVTFISIFDATTFSQSIDRGSGGFLLDLYSNEPRDTLPTENSKAEKYRGTRIIMVTPSSDLQVQYISSLEQSLPADVIYIPKKGRRRLPGSKIEVQVSQGFAQIFEHQLTTRGINYRIEVEDLARSIESEDLDELEAENRLSSNKRSIVGTFPSLPNYQNWIRSLCSEHANIATCGHLRWQTYEGNPIHFVKIGKAASTTKKHTIMFEGGMHGREWIVPATLVALIDKLVRGSEVDPVIGEMLANYDFLFVPLANPDGYNYTHYHDRFWRKNRVLDKRSQCYGVDLNRNFGFRWGSDSSTQDGCDEENFAGSSGHSQAETRGLAHLAEQHRESLLAYFSIHSFGKSWLLPYGSGPKPDDYDELQRVAEIGVAAMKPDWRVGNSQDLYYPASGGSEDFMKHNLGVPYSYCLELMPSLDETPLSYAGFIVKTSNILPMADELWQGISAAILAMMKQ